MTCNAKGYLRYPTRIMTATIALVAGFYLVISGATAQPAAGEGSSEVRKGGWLSRLLPGASRVDPVEDRADPQYVGAYSKNKPTDNTAEPAASTRSNVDGKEDLFLPGPQYDQNYDAKSQVDVYGAKTVVEPPRPLELGRQQYTPGLYDESSTLLGTLNPLLPGLAIYGDWRTAVAYNGNNGKDIAQIATRLNIDIDFKITGTERIHAFFTPIQKGNVYSRFEFGGGDGNNKFNDEFDPTPQTLFFEGDFGSIYSGFSGREASFDLPFTVGLFPLFLQNGIWANDAVLGGAVSLTAKNSKRLGLSNYDITFFAAYDNVDNKGIIGANEDDNRKANLYGVTAFIDAFRGYIETGYGLVQGREDQVDGQLTHFVTASYSRRYGNVLSNSTRVFGNFGNGINDEGVAIISENSLISGLPSTLLPYANFFVGFQQPSTPGRWQWRGHPEERRHQLRDRRPDRLPETQRHRLQRLWRCDRLAVSLQSGSAARLRGGNGSALRRSDPRHRRRQPAVRLRCSLSDPDRPGLAVPRRCDLSDP